MNFMRAIALTVLAVLAGSAHPAGAQNMQEADRVRDEALPLFVQDRCAEFKDPAEQLFCGDPALKEAGARLNAATEARLNRIADRRVAIEENAEWIRNRNSSCGMFGGRSVPGRDIPYVKTCLLKETEERIAILNDPNFDCLATDTPAGRLICSDPELAVADQELDDLVIALISRLKEDDAKRAFSEHARWVRTRDRKCDLDDKDNVPPDELSRSAGCLTEYMRQKTAEIGAAKSDPKRVFGRPSNSATPDADAVDLCVAQIHAANACENFLRVSRVIEIDTEISAAEALVTAEVEMKVLSPFAMCSPIASSCTGMCWDLKSNPQKKPAGGVDSIPVAYRLKIEKSFAFRKTGGGWGCGTTVLQPVDLGIAQSGP